MTLAPSASPLGVAETASLRLAIDNQTALGKGMAVLARILNDAAALGTPHSLLVRCIRHIDVLSISKEVIRIATRWIVTTVTRVGAEWEWPMCQFVGEPMGGDSATRVIRATSNAKQSIAAGQTVGSPLPTLIGIALANVIPETLSDWFRLWAGHRYLQFTNGLGAIITQEV